MTLRDTRMIGRRWGVALLGLRLIVLGLGVIIALNPHERSQTDVYRDSRVLLLVDTSQSMQQPERDPRDASGAAGRTRAEAVQALLRESPLLAELQKDHAVEVYTFDSDLSESKVRFPSSARPAATVPAPLDGTSNNAPPPPDWKALLQPLGTTTRLGDALDTLLLETRSPTLSGVVVFSDGGSNAGRDVTAPRERARDQGVRLVTIGVGSTTPPVNLEVTRLVSPTDVQLGDAFELSAQLRGDGVASREVQLDLLQQGPGDPDPIVLLTRSVMMPEDGSSTTVLFDQLKPPVAGDFEWTVRARIPGVVETRDDDNQQSRSVAIFDRPFRVLLIAGGPQRDYHYARTILFRHPSMETDVWLQTGEVGISQEADQLLFRFPENLEDLYKYDVVLAFDPNWSLLTDEQRTRLTNWISNEGGGMILVAGDIFTPAVAAESQLESIRKLYPVLLEEVSLRPGAREISATAYPLGLTQAGQAAEFLKLEETSGKSAWEEFPGVYRVYPTRGVKAGTTVYAEFTDPLARGRGGQPPVLAGHRFGQGQVLYLGSPELWRLRAIDTVYLERLWVKLVRKAAEGRSKRGLQRSMFVMDGREFPLGQSIAFRVRSLSAQFEPLATDTITINAFGPGGAPITPSPVLQKDPVRPAEFVGDFRPMTPGRYRLEYAVPDSADRISAEIEAQLPRQEVASLVQNVDTLQQLTAETGGDYVTLERAATDVPRLLPNKGESVVVGQQIRELWDRGWLMLVMVLVLSADWLMRKLLKLA